MQQTQENEHSASALQAGTSVLQIRAPALGNRAYRECTPGEGAHLRAIEQSLLSPEIGKCVTNYKPKFVVRNCGFSRRGTLLKVLYKAYQPHQA